MLLSNLAPAVLERPARTPRPGPAARPEGSAAEGQLPARPGCRALRDPTVDPEDAFAGTFHVNESDTQLEAAYAQAAAGRIPDAVPCEIYCHSLSDPSILGPGRCAPPAPTR